ncbi:MAG: hypothetical protein HYY06_20660 [Deltaproteobacteria bacterium]|nr:hypothetical protein [Deltaproteobacteria bacterium]
MAAIARAPAAFPMWRDDRPYRRAVMPRRLPFVVFFEEKEDAVRIWAIAHARRRPGYWIRRTRREL